MKEGRRLRGIVGRGLIRMRRKARQAYEREHPIKDPAQAELLELQADLLREQDDLDRRRSQVSLPQMVFGWFKKKAHPDAASERPDPVPADDPVRQILAVPRGPARLDAFAATLQALTPGSHGHRGVALAFHRELLALADAADLDLTLLAARVEACATALADAGEAELAGVLLGKIGKKHRAAELFVSSGAIDKLLAAHHDIEEREGSQRVSARIAFERFEALYLIGQRREALAALRDAAEQWPDNPAYQEVLAGFEERLTKPGLLTLRKREESLVVTTRWPLLFGRHEHASLVLASPLVSRAHAEIFAQGDALLAQDVSGRDDVELDGAPLRTPTPLGERGTLSLGGVLLRYQRQADALAVHAEQRPNHRLLAARSRTVQVQDALSLRFDDDERALLLPSPKLRLSGDVIRQETLLLRTDRIQPDTGAPWVVD